MSIFKLITEITKKPSSTCDKCGQEMTYMAEREYYCEKCGDFNI